MFLFPLGTTRFVLMTSCIRGVKLIQFFIILACHKKTQT